MKNAIAISHVCFEDAGTLEDAITARGHPIPLSASRRRRSRRRPRTPTSSFVLGGPIGVYEVDRYPFLKHEFAVIETVLARGKPIVGICLGAQLLAAVLGSPRLSGPREGDRLGPARPDA